MSLKFLKVMQASRLKSAAHVQLVDLVCNCCQVCTHVHPLQQAFTKSYKFASVQLLFFVLILLFLLFAVCCFVFSIWPEQMFIELTQTVLWAPAKDKFFMVHTDDPWQKLLSLCIMCLGTGFLDSFGTAFFYGRKGMLGYVDMLG